MYFETIFSAVYKVFSLSVDETWKTPFNNFFPLQNWKIVFKECQKHFLMLFEYFEDSSEGTMSANEAEP